ncbi:hypothetical protein C8R43DRAFT_1135844 [Mycena crocata]|nr:hypothetical protein C8R43DRAFT_1135844 [Mycena crocata]
MGVFGAHFGDPRFLLDIPSPEKAAAPDGHRFQIGDFGCPLWINPKFPYLVLLPRYNPFYGPLFSCLNVTKKNLPIEEVITVPLGETSPQVRWGLDQTLIDRWLRLESLLRLTLRSMMDLYGGRAALGVYTFLNPISYRYTERNALSRSSAVDIALRSRDAFLPLMAKLTLMIILLDASNRDDWRDKLLGQTKLHWQWLVDLEHSAVGDFHIDRMGGIIDLTLSKSHPDQHLPRHARWLLSHLLGRHREPIPDSLVKIGFVPDSGEVEFLDRLPGDVVFSPWQTDPSLLLWTSCRGGAPPSARLSSHAPPTYYHSQLPVDDTIPARSFPAVEHDSGQRHGEDIHAFMERRRLHNEKRALHETSQAKDRRIAQENNAMKGGPPGKKGARVFIWEEEEGGFFIWHACNRTDAADRWDEFTPKQRVYNGFSNQWDLCTVLAPSEEAEPDDCYDDDDDFQFHQPASPTDIIPSIPDVPGCQAMEEETLGASSQIQAPQIFREW